MAHFNISFGCGNFLNKNVSLSISSGPLNTSSYFFNISSNSLTFLFFSFFSLVNLGFCLYKKSTSTPMFFKFIFLIFISSTSSQTDLKLSILFFGECLKHFRAAPVVANPAVCASDFLNSFLLKFDFFSSHYNIIKILFF